MSQNNKKVFITGISGFAGSHLADLCLAKGYDVFGSVRLRDDVSNIEHIKDKIQIEYLDILDSKNCDEVMKRVMPDIVFHLAAQSFVGKSWEAPDLTLSTNILGTLNVLESVRKYRPDAIFHVASSSQVYGKVEKFPMTVDTPFNPMSPYDVSKLSQEMLVRQYHNSYGMDVRITRAFNITGPRRADMFAETTFTKQIVEIEKGLKEPVIKVGNLDSARDYIDVRDAVRGYLMAVENGKSGEVYLLCSGIPRKISLILDQLLKLSPKGLSIRIEQDSERMRPSDTSFMQGDYSSAKEGLGWKPVIPMVRTLYDLLEYYRGIIK